MLVVQMFQEYRFFKKYISIIIPLVIVVSFNIIINVSFLVRVCQQVPYLREVRTIDFFP